MPALFPPPVCLVTSIAQIHKNILPLIPEKIVVTVPTLHDLHLCAALEE